MSPEPLDRGLELIDAGHYFEAHEELEVAWRAATAPERDFLQGLVHVTVAWYQAGRGNRVGCERQLEKARRRLGPYAPSHGGLDIDGILVSVEGAAQLVASGSLALPPPRLPRSAVEAEEAEGPVEVDTQPPETVREEQGAQGDEDQAADELDRHVVVADTPEETHRRNKERRGGEERHGQPETVDGQER